MERLGYQPPIGHENPRNHRQPLDGIDPKEIVDTRPRWCRPSQESPVFLPPMARATCPPQVQRGRRGCFPDSFLSPHDLAFPAGPSRRPARFT